MMAEEEKMAWKSVSEEAAAYVVDVVRKAAAESLLRGALRKVTTATDLTTEARDALIYQVLMAGKDAGYECGVWVHDPPYGAITATAYIKLPNGVIGMRLIVETGTDYIVYGEDARETVKRFLGD